MAKKSLIAKTERTPKFNVRKYNRCPLCGRPRGYMRKFQMCRICFRQRALNGELPGVTKASWSHRVVASFMRFSYGGKENDHDRPYG